MCVFADNYVHRLVQNKEDGKLVEVGTQGQLPSDQKMDSLQLEVLFLCAHVTCTAACIHMCMYVC